LIWKIRWKLSDKPWILRLRKDLRIAVFKDGQGALLFYQGFAEQETEAYLNLFLRPGMVFFDIGAHVGTYTLLAARTVGAQGEVHSFEPNPGVFGLLEENVRLNALRNVQLQRAAVSDKVGECEFEICRESTISSLKTGAGRPPEGNAGSDIQFVVHVRCTALDAYCSTRGIRPALVKVDAEGAEILVLRGALELLRLPAAEAPAWVFEYSIANFARFGYGADELLGLLKQCGYEVWWYRGRGCIESFQPELAGSRTMNLVAVKAGQKLPMWP
jgi:FkbM family methyltransferase